MRWQYLLSSVASVAIVVGAANTARGQEKPKPPAKSEMKKAETKATKAAAKTESAAEHAEHKAFDRAESEPKKLLKGIKLTVDEKKQVNTIEKKYRDQLHDLRKTHEAAEKAGKEDDSQIVAKVQAIVDQERSELRGALTTAQQAAFDKNAAKIKS